jgi:hypothetical protein
MEDIENRIENLAHIDRRAWHAALSQAGAEIKVQRK